ncbi:tripartite tricarboxylate transporter TctB family protein [Arthrobacter sp. Cr_A7]|uniref:tripartite tricarboxylate transporter TctB family protein n=1 Tax=Arthrobacter sp. Cr_A7 TaxID=3031017 RepID=UPI0023DB218E|nr:tripartite tricarboxylate transporter TctB family protein [Arthrobacter sp. Cr_A7]MDF2050376.1 tripartite tricarboxylate transporter TctB family protein [Arthrobacter sp. Cr_A7]
MQTLNAPVALEWTVAAAAIGGGLAIAGVGAGYGLANTSGVGAGFFPTVAGSMVALAGVLWILQLAAARKAAVPAAPVGDTLESVPPHHDSGSALVSLLDDDNSEEPEADFPDRQGWARVGIIIAAILLAALLLPLLGYTVVMTLMLGAILHFVSKRKLWLAVMVAIGAALASRLVFEVWLGTALPTASIEFLAGLGL